ncbi:MAG: ATP-dependent sacrificial sulfur transferase LarE [Anaerolineae bacterium]
MNHLKDIQAKLEQARDMILHLGSTVVAYSGGVDSTLLLALCLEVLGPDNVLAVTARSPTYPEREMHEAERIARTLGARLRLIETRELDDPCFASNPPNRCYFCKQELFNELWNIAQQEGLQNVVYGGNADDLQDYRPGMQAAKETGVRAPLLEAGLTKEEVRIISQEMGLSTWDKPAMACLASRVPYGTSITPEVLKRIELAESFLRDELGLTQFRVRHHPPIARLEILPKDWERVLVEETRQRIVARLRELGYLYVTLDLAGYRSGSLNDAIKL